MPRPPVPTDDQLARMSPEDARAAIFASHVPIPLRPSGPIVGIPVHRAHGPDSIRAMIGTAEAELVRSHRINAGSLRVTGKPATLGVETAERRLTHLRAELVLSLAPAAPQPVFLEAAE